MRERLVYKRVLYCAVSRERHAAMFSALGTTTVLHNVALTDAAGAELAHAGGGLG